MPASTKQATKHEAAVAQNKQSLREAEESRLVSSWLKASLKSTHQLPIDQSSRSHTTTVNAINPDNQRKDDESDFSADEEGEGGLGFITPQGNGDGLDRQHLSANDKLRRQMLGKNAFKAKMSASTPLPLQSRKIQVNDSDDETEGRTRLAGKKSNLISRTQPTTTTNEVDDDGGANHSSTATKALTRKRPASYLDEMLAKRSAKKNKAPNQPQIRKAKKSDREDD